jgi:predicted nucleic acid-binding protein
VTRFVVDAGVLLGIADGSIVVAPEHQLVAPGGLRSQALAALYAAVRRGELDRKDALARLERVTEVKVRLLNDRVSRSVAWKIAEEQGWSDTADAEYAAVTRLQADALVTLDAERARLLEGVVPLADVAALGT